ncbi:hypothetical protein GOP47_0027163 [Adiantum capillus-veneris]|nr:hypothetical protein GOP47_0027163 [Adiantum capillus-veneris]
MATGAPNWSSTLEDLLDDGNTGEAQRLLEGLVAELRARPDASTNLTLAAALSDLASLYHALGLSSRADSASSSALLIKQTAQFYPSIRTTSSPNSAGDHILSETASLPTREEGPGSECVEEWESLLSEETVNIEALSLTKHATESPPHERTSYKQRGRGVFTRGEMGMYIDRLTTCSIRGREYLDTMTEEIEHEVSVPNVQSKVTYGVRHVLIVSFPPSVTSRDLEELFEPFGSDGVAIRWVNDTTALAVFRNPETAKEALQSPRNPHFKVELLADDDALLALVKEQDLRPPVPRPATSSQAAHRMIMGALQRQGVKKQPISMSSFKSSQQQEAERKQRLHTRQKLRDEAWGSEV